VLAIYALYVPSLSAPRLGTLTSLCCRRLDSLTSPFLLLALVFLFGGFTAINKFGAFLCLPAPRRDAHPHTGPSEPVQIGSYVITQKLLYTALFVIGLPLLWLSSPFKFFFWLVGASSCLVLAHAALMEPGVESEYASVQDSV
jgi:hypothetical protein